MSRISLKPKKNTGTVHTRIFKNDLVDLRTIFPLMTGDANRINALIDTNMRARAELKLNRFRLNIGEEIGINHNGRRFINEKKSRFTKK